MIPGRLILTCLCGIVAWAALVWLWLVGYLVFLFMAVAVVTAVIGFWHVERILMAPQYDYRAMRGASSLVLWSVVALVVLAVCAVW